MCAAPSPPLLKAHHLSVIRQGKAILENVSLTLKECDFVTVIGPNGAGKSTLLKCLMGIIPPDQGTIMRKQSLKIGYVPQKLVPDHTLPITVKRFLSLRKKATPEMFTQISEETGITNILEKFLHVLSGGELQRVLLARSLLGSPEVLILDEPAQNLDISGQIAFYKLLEKICKHYVPLSILMVSHDLHMVMALTKQVVCLFHHVCCSGEPHIVTQDPEFISLFGQDMAHMMAFYHHSHTHFHEGFPHVSD